MKYLIKSISIEENVLIVDDQDPFESALLTAVRASDGFIVKEFNEDADIKAMGEIYKRIHTQF